jgi:hypothetical protein
VSNASAQQMSSKGGKEDEAATFLWPAMNGSAVLNVSASSTGRPWLNLPIAEKTRRQSRSPPAKSPTFLRAHATHASANEPRPNQTAKGEWRVGGRWDYA